MGDIRDGAMSGLRRATGEKVKDIVCKTCGHYKVWHYKEGPCRMDYEGVGECDCVAWVYGVNVETIIEYLRKDD